MKKIILSIFLIAGFLQSCNKDFDTLNINTKAPASVSPGTLFATATRSYARFSASPNVNTNIWRLISQYWTETTYTDESNYDLSTRSIPRSVWNALYAGVLADLSAAANLVPGTISTANDKKAQLAQIQVLRALTYYTLVNTFGDVPYSEALNPSNSKPKYDSGLAIYNDLLIRLDAAIADLATQGGFGSADILFGGNSEKWKKLANTLKLKIGINLADIDNAKAKSVVESAVASGVISSNGENALFAFASTNPNANPVWEDLVFSGRNDFVITNTFVDQLNTLEDPRRVAFMTLGPADDYVGGINGSNNNYPSFSHCSDELKKPDSKAILMDYTEVCFLLAEAAERGYTVGGSAESFYNSGITASFEYYKVAGVSAYLANPKVKYTSAAGTWKQKIGIQAWIGLYNRGHEAWTSWRRLDFPALVAPSSAISAIPVRYPYSVDEQTLNKSNWLAASTAIGGDLVATKLFWDKN